MHVLFTVHRFWPAVGGTEIQLMELARRLVAMGHDVTVATSDEEGSPAEEVHEGIRIRRFAMVRRGKFRFPPREYVRFVLDGPWDLVHVKGQRVWSSDYLFRHVPKIRQPKVFTAHGFHQWHMHKRDLVELGYYKWHLPRMLRPFDRIVALTTPEVEELADFGVARDKITILPDGVNLQEFETPPAPGFREKFGVRAKHMLLYAGGAYDNKRVDFLVEAAARMKGDVELVVIGKDPFGLGKEAEALAQRIGAPARFLGVVSREDMLRAFFEADLFLLASKFEGYGIVLLETMAARVPFVSTPCGGAPDLAATGAGRLASTPEEMARVADELLADPALRARMGEAGRAHAMRQTLDWNAREHEKLYEDVLARRSRA